MVSNMIQHFDLSRSHLATASDVREALDHAYQAKPKDPVRIAQLNDHLRHHMATARMHAHLAEVHALYDLRGSVDQLFQALTAEPQPVEIPRRPAEVLELVPHVDERCPNCSHVLYLGECPDCADGLLKS